MAIKRMGIGAVLNSKIPEDSENYALMLISKKKILSM
jgi:hypothetical protein